MIFFWILIFIFFKGFCVFSITIMLWIGERDAYYNERKQKKRSSHQLTEDER